MREARTAAGRFELTGRGADLEIDVAGPTAAACLAAAVEGLAASLTELTDLTAAQKPRSEDVEVTGDDLAGVLVRLIDEVILRLDADGELAVGLTDAEVADRTLRGRLQLVDLAAVTVHGEAPKAATWHGVALEPAAEGGWHGRVMVDL